MLVYLTYILIQS